ncbi:hypothetical protein [Aliarcobacter butzleri]|uniref:hypothetical protein n=1 Tax=Aliarcobacter butzleri TaxID=28197 RepID=UPI00344FF41B
MSCDKERSCFYLELGKGIKIVLIVSLIISLMPSFLDNIQQFINGLNIGKIKTKEIEIEFYQKNLNNIVESATKKDISKEDIVKQLSDLERFMAIRASTENIFNDLQKNNSKECANINLTKEEIKNYLGLEIDDFNLSSYIHKEFRLLRSIDTYEGCNKSYFVPITIKINTSIVIRNIYKDNLFYSLEILY